MNSFVKRYSTTNQLRTTQHLGEDQDFSDAAWGSEAGFGSLAKGRPTFTVPDVPDVSPRNPRRSITRSYKLFRFF